MANEDNDILLHLIPPQQDKDENEEDVPVENIIDDDVDGHSI